MQSTFTEWQQSGVTETCQDCHMPGDLFRHLTVEARPDDTWVVLHTIGRQFEVQWEDSSPRKRLVDDTSLRPGVPVTVALPGDVPWRVRYHYGSPRDEARVRVPLEQLIVVVAESTP